MLSLKNYSCPQCNGRMFNVDPNAFLNAKGKNVEKLPMSCRGCGYEGTAKDFSSVGRKQDNQPELSPDEDPDQW